MFWRFGFHNASSIDSLLDKEDVALEAILDEDDLLQECKAQNTRLIDYFQRIDVLQKLLGYVTGQIEGDERGRFKYPYVATEVLCSEIWSIVETCMNHQEEIMIPFWETVLDRPAEDMKTEMVMASHFAKVNAVFLSKRPAEMLAFIQAQSSIVERLLRHVETPAFVDLLVRIIQLDEQPGGAGVLEWLSTEHLMARLIDMLSPAHTTDVHTVVADLIKGIISMAAPSPGAAGFSEGLQNGPASNRFARELAAEDSVKKLTGYILDDFQPASFAEDSLPSMQSATSSIIHSISIIIELIRKNNSDYFEPYLFHTLRNRLIQVQQQLQPEDGRLTLEQAMKEMVDRMGVVHLGPMLDIMCERMDAFERYLRQPRSLEGEMSTTIGAIKPLTFERYRICELYAELLHCSNMSLLNRPAEYSHLYDSDGRLQGGLTALEELAHVIALGSGDAGSDAMDEGLDGDRSHDTLTHGSGSHDSSSIIDSDEDMSDDDPGSSDDDEVMEEIAMHDEPFPVRSRTPDAIPVGLPPVPSPPHTGSPLSHSDILSPNAPLAKRVGSFSELDIARPRSAASSLRQSRRPSMVEAPDAPVPVGERLKRKFLDMNVLSTLLDLFFEFPWNNFLHSVVYDLVHQILTGRVDGGLNRELTLALFRDGRLMHRIVEGQQRNDTECAKPKGVRLGYMGHLTLISEDLISAISHYPPDLRVEIEKHAPQPAWDEYVSGRYNETKKRDTSLLGGGKPVVAAAAAGTARVGAGAGVGGATRWKVDEEDAAGTSIPGLADEESPAGKNEFKRATSVRPGREGSGDFESSELSMDDDEERSPPQFARYLAQEMHSADHFGDASDDEDEDGGWLSHSTFGVSEPPVSAPRRSANSTDRRPLATSGFDDSFGSDDTPTGMDPFASDEDAFGPFSDNAAGGSEPFTFSSFSEEIEDTAFDSFGDFGDFQSSSGDGDLTPTGSWTFTSSSSPSEDGLPADGIRVDEEEGEKKRGSSSTP